LKPQDLRRYAKIVSDIIDSTQSNGEDLNADYEVLRKSIDDKTVSDLGSDRLTQIKTHFQSGTDKYQDNVNKLEQAPVPVKILGKHKILVRAYADYADACQDMTDSLNPEDASIDAEKFNRSEKDQENHIAKVSDVTTRIMGML
jgi:polar amino acid transport system substrate-binding protein